MTETAGETVQRVLENMLGIPFTEGNRIDVLRNGNEIFPAMLEAIDAAQSRIELLTFVYWTGDIAQRFARALADRARAGVDVKVILDAVGAAAMSEALLQMLRDAGVDVQWFRPVTRWNPWQIDNRTHRKVLVVDGLVGFTGGIVLNSLLVLDPAAFNLPPHGHALPDGIGHAPALLGAAFASLTTVGSPVLNNGSLTSLTASVGITIVGQLYVAIMIAGVLGKPRQAPAAAPTSAHPQGPSAAAPSRMRRFRR